MNRLKTVGMLGGAAIVAGCPALFLPPNASSPSVVPRPDSGAVASTALGGPLGGHYRVKLFDRTRTREFDLNLEQAGRYVFGRLAPLNGDPVPAWTADGEYTLTPAGEATMSIVFTLGSTTSAEPATTSIALKTSFAMADLSLASPAPSPLPTPTPYPTPRAGSGSVGGDTIAAPVKFPIGPGTYSQAFVGTWAEGGQATGSVTGLKFSPR